MSIEIIDIESKLAILVPAKCVLSESALARLGINVT